MIEELDEKKKETLKVTWLKVNKYESFDDSLHISADSVSLYILLKMSLILISVQIEVCKLKSNSYHSVSIGILNLYLVLFYLVQWRNLILQKVALSWMVLKFVWHLGQFGSSLFLNLVEGNGPFLLLVLSWLCFFFKPAPLYILDEVSLNIIYYSNSLPLPFSLFI